MQKKKIIVIGGGAAGLMAAGTAAECGADVTLLEKMKTPARKIRITGKGRCNLSNTADLPDFLGHFGKSGRFLRQAFGQYFSEELVAFFEARGLPIAYERGGRIFPAENDAPAVARVLVNWVQEAGVRLETDARVTELLIADNRITGLICNRRKVEADSIILATGGRSYPRTGSTGDGYRLAQAAGHTIIAARPALVSLKTGSDVRGLAGLTVRNVTARLYIDGKKKQQEFGELTFTRTGLGGPIILSLSPLAVDSLKGGKRLSIHLDLKPALDEQKLDARLLRDLEKRHREPMDSVLRGLLPKALVDYCIQVVGIDPDQEAGLLSSKMRRSLRQWLKDIRFDITGHGSWDEAIVTAGGVKTGEINPHTMESKITTGLYIVGELLDIQADTGGYNLQAAFSTGWAAGRAVSGSAG